MTSHVDEQIKARIAEARRKRERRRRQRAEFDEARAYGLEARVAAKVARWNNPKENTMTVTDLNARRTFRPGDMVLILAAPALAPDEPDIITLGTVTPTPAHAMCVTCHCTPVGPDHQGDASECCPGPWFMVEFECRRSCSIETPHVHEMTFAAHELAPATQASGPACKGCPQALPDGYRDDFCPACHEAAANTF
jgi:hypothetical protein